MFQCTNLPSEPSATCGTVPPAKLPPLHLLQPLFTRGVQRHLSDHRHEAAQASHDHRARLPHGRRHAGRPLLPAAPGRLGTRQPWTSRARRTRGYRPEHPAGGEPRDLPQLQGVPGPERAQGAGREEQGERRRRERRGGSVIRVVRHAKATDTHCVS